MLVSPWVTAAELPADRPALPGGDEAWDDLCAVASEVLYALSGRQYPGVSTTRVEVTARPVGTEVNASVRPALGVPGEWYDTSWGLCADPLGLHDSCSRPATARKRCSRG